MHRAREPLRLAGRGQHCRGNARRSERGEIVTAQPTREPRAPAGGERHALPVAARVLDPRQHRLRPRGNLHLRRGQVQIGEDYDEFAHGRYRNAIVKFTLEASAGSNLIRGYSDTEIRVGERRVQGSCLVTADQLLTHWGAAEFADLSVAHADALLALGPELVILGTGMTQHFAPLQLRKALAARGIGLEAMQLGAACRTFNVLVQEERRVAAALFLR